MIQRKFPTPIHAGSSSKMPHGDGRTLVWAHMAIRPGSDPSLCHVNSISTASWPNESAEITALRTSDVKCSNKALQEDAVNNNVSRTAEIAVSQSFSSWLKSRLILMAKIRSSVISCHEGADDKPYSRTKCHANNSIKYWTNFHQIHLHVDPDFFGVASYSICYC